MAHHFWELGIDLNAIVEGETSYMTGAFVAGDVVRRPHVIDNDRITFRVFDMSKENPNVLLSDSLSLRIHSREAIVDQPPGIEPLSPGQLAGTNIGNQPSLYFGDSFPCWESEPTFVHADATLTVRGFLLTFKVKALADARTFVHDPEMVVGPDM